jgi:hypothetical protein
MEDLLGKIRAAFLDFNIEAEKYATKGNKSAGTRARVISGKIRDLMKEFRATKPTIKKKNID